MIALFFAVALLVPPPVPQLEFVVQQIRATPLDDKGNIELFLIAQCPVDGQVFRNSIRTKVDPSLYARELRVLDSRHATSTSGRTEVSRTSLFFAYQVINNDAPQGLGGWTPVMQWVEVELTLDPDGPELAIEKKLTLIIPRPDKPDDEEGITFNVESTLAHLTRSY